MSRDWHLAQVNIGRLVAPQGDPRVQPFFDALDRINALAEASPGFVWRLKGEGNNATDLQPTPDPLLIPNMSVWTDADALFAFVYRSAHTPAMARRREYFERFDGAYQALWWIPAGETPTVTDALSRLWMLDRFGPTPHAFTFKARFPAPGVGGGRSTTSPTRGVSVPPEPDDNATRGSEPSILDVALKGLCPRCGRPTLFAGLLTFADRCRHCGLDIAGFNVGDGPAAFLTLIIGTIVVALVVWVQLAFAPPWWAHVLIWPAVTVALVAGSLRLAKGALIAAEYRNAAREERW